MLARLGVIALVFGLTPVTGLQAQENEPEPEIQPEAAQEESSGQSTVEPAPVEPTVPLPANEASTEHDEGSAPDAQDEPQQIPGIILGDGWAQWAMALTGLGALLVSVWAVRLLKATLKETREAVRAADDAVTVTREMGKKQVRAYLSFKDVRIQDHGENPEQNALILFVDIKNSGNSPAVGGKLRMFYRFYPVKDFEKLETCAWLRDVEINNVDSAGVTTMAMFRAPKEAIKACRSFAVEFEIRILIEYIDVFGDEHSSEGFYYLCGPDFSAPMPSNPKVQQIRHQ